MNKKRTAIEPTRAQDFPEWYQQVVKAAELAEHTPVRGCMVIKPWGYRIWENIQRVLDKKIKETGHQNLYFPLFIPLSYFEREAKHVEGFATECAVVTHHRLEKDKEGKLNPAGPLEEPLVVRPTSEMVIGEMYSKWVQSYRDLPLLYNQWANVVRWEMRPRLFLRTAEFLWQEGHTAHATKNEALEESLRMLEVYVTFLREYLAFPVIEGRKSEREKFPGAEETFTFEAMMQDGKALQAGTSHFLGQNFAKAANIKFRDAEGKEAFAWTTSWGVTTRLIGGMIMIHSDDDGLALPPRIASAHIVIIPVIHKEEDRSIVLSYCELLAKELSELDYWGQNLVVNVDDRDMRSGEKVWGWVKKGVPIRLEIGPREINENRLCITKRNCGAREFFHQTKEEFVQTIVDQLEEIQAAMLQKAETFLQTNTVQIDSKEDFYNFFKEKKGKSQGFALAHWSGESKIEDQIKKDLNVTLRCIPLNAGEEGTCIFTGKKSKQRVVFARSY